MARTELECRRSDCSLKGQYAIFIFVRCEVIKNCYVKLQRFYVFWGRASYHAPSLSGHIEPFLSFCSQRWTGRTSMLVYVPVGPVVPPPGRSNHPYFGQTCRDF